MLACTGELVHIDPRARLKLYRLVNVRATQVVLPFDMLDCVEWFYLVQIQRCLEVTLLLIVNGMQHLPVTGNRCRRCQRFWQRWQGLMLHVIAILQEIKILDVVS